MPLSTQELLEIKQIREGLIVLKNNQLRGILMISSINFVLKSEEEQKAIIYHFQAFLNSLDFYLQIVVQSRRTNIRGYIDKIKELKKEQTNDLLRHQTAGYIDFLEEFVRKEDVYSKNFFVVVPYSVGETKTSTRDVVASRKGTLSEEVFKRSRDQLYQRMEFVALGLRRCSLHSVPLTSSELIELLWSMHHPKQAEKGYFPEIPEELIM